MKSLFPPLLLVALFAAAQGFSAIRLTAKGSFQHRKLPVVRAVQIEDINGERVPGADPKADLQEIAQDFQERTGRIMFSVRELEKEHAEIVRRLEDDSHVGSKVFEVPRTTKDALHTALQFPATQFVLVNILVAMALRLSLPEPLGFADLLTVLFTRVFWEAQEWFFHSEIFHGGEDGRAHSLFQIHDHHHDLPYFHVAIEPIRMIVVWWMVVLGMTCGTVHFLGAPATTMTTAFSSYVFFATTYMGMHYLTHTKIPFTGWLQKTRELHINHHQSPMHNLNMGPNNIDKIMNTNSYNSRFNARGRN